MTQIYIKQYIHKHWTQNFQRISPFRITPVEKAHKARTRWYRGPFRQFINTRFLKSILKKIFSQLVSWYFEPSQPQRVTSWLKTMFNLSPIYSARKSSNHKLSINHKTSHDTNLHKTIHTQTSDTKYSKNQSLRYHPC